MRMKKFRESIQLSIRNHLFSKKYSAYHAEVEKISLVDEDLSFSNSIQRLAPPKNEALHLKADSHSNMPTLSLEPNEVLQTQAMLVEENDKLLEFYDSSSDKVRESEMKLETIGNLMSEFSLNVLQQSESIDTLHDVASNTSTHLTRANAELQKATESGVDFRIISLLIMIIAGLAMLFIDWMS